METVLFASPQEITISTIVGGNVDVDKYNMHISDTQVFTIKPLLGSLLYDKIVADEDVLREVASIEAYTVSCEDMKFSPLITDVNTQLSIDFFDQMDECGQYAHQDFMNNE